MNFTFGRFLIIFFIFIICIGIYFGSGLFGKPSKSTPFSGVQQPTFYVDTARNKIVSKLTFDEIAKKVASFQNNVGLTSGGQAEVLAYVFFDPLCVHCATLAKNMMSPDAIHIVNNIAWVPVGYLQEYSTLQGAAILGSSSPAMAMTTHAANVLEGGGKEFQINVRLSKQEDIDLVVENTRVWSEAGATQVPFIVTKDSKGKTLSIYGVLEGFQMAEFVSRPRL